MIKFLRKIRQELMEKGKTGKYLKYAISEIVLVVIGILIAISINNWNDSKKDKVQEGLILEDLKEEFEQNRKILKERVALLDTSISGIESLFNYFGASEGEIKQVDIQGHLEKSLYYGNFNPSNSAINELIQSGRLQLISNRKIKDQINNWLAILQDTDEDFKNQDAYFSQKIESYLSERVSSRNRGFLYENSSIKGNSKLIKDSYYDILQDFKFENLMYNGLFWHMNMVKHYRELDSLAVQIIGQIETQD
jgi:uncharacterized protein DUF6090